MIRPALFLIAVGACGSDHGHIPDAQALLPDGAMACTPGLAGAPCVLALYDRAAASCDPSDVEALRGELDARAELGPLWAGGRALFRTPSVVHIAGTFNAWSGAALATAPLCGSSLVLAVAPVASGFHQYKLVTGETWQLDAANPAFAYDDYAGNPDGQNSVLATHDSGRGHLIKLDRVCSTTLGNCRDVTAYVPPGYDAPDAATRRYPVLFMHDGKNVWDDHQCCFGHTGWEVNVALDAEIQAGRVAPVIVVAVDQTPQRNNEYGLSATVTAAFMDLQVNQIQPRALAKLRGDGSVYVAGSSLGGLVSLALALRHPQTYAGAAALSGAFWPGMDDGTALRDQLPSIGKQPLAIYLDHGGSLATNSDGAADSVEIRDLLVGLGWQRADSPACTPGPPKGGPSGQGSLALRTRVDRSPSGPNAVCYFFEPGATHDELAWKARTWRMLRFLFPR